MERTIQYVKDRTESFDDLLSLYQEEEKMQIISCYELVEYVCRGYS